VTSLTENLLTRVTDFLYDSPLTEGEFGKRAIGDSGFVASLRKGDGPTMDTADRALLCMGEPAIGLAFRSEVAAFLLITETNGSELGYGAIGDPAFMTKLNSGVSPRLSAVERIRKWMRKIASYGERAVIARAIADPGVPKPALNPDPAALDTLADGAPCAVSDRESPPGECSHPIEQRLLLTESEAADFLRFSPVTLSRYRYTGDGPAYCKLGGAIRYYRADLLAWAWAKRRGYPPRESVTDWRRAEDIRNPVHARRWHHRRRRGNEVRDDPDG